MDGESGGEAQVLKRGCGADRCHSEECCREDFEKGIERIGEAGRTHDSEALTSVAHFLLGLRGDQMCKTAEEYMPLRPLVLSNNPR